MAIIEENTGSSNVTITQEVIDQILRTGKWAEDPALTLVCSDADLAETAKNTKQWIAGWNSASTLYQSTTAPKYWEGTQVTRANIPFYTVAKTVNSLTPQIVSGLFYDDPPFIFQPMPGTSQDAADANSDIISFQLKKIKFKEEVRRGVMNATLFGTNIWKWGWDSYTETKTYFARDDEGETMPSDIPGQPDLEFHDPEAPLIEKTEKHRVEQPRFENITSIKDVLVDPTLRTPDIREAKFVIHRMYLTYNDLDKLRDVPGYNIPSKQEVISWFAPPEEEAIPALGENTGLNSIWDLRANPRWEDGTNDPFNQPLEVLERWDKEKLIIVVQRKKVICNSKNQYGEIPFLSVNWWDTPSAFYGIGVSKTVGSEQSLQQGIVNTWLDSTALALAGVYARKRGKSNFTQNFRIHPGRVIEIDEKGDIEPLDRPPAVPEAGEHLSLSAQRVEQNSGAGEISSQGSAGSTGHSNLARTAVGANAIMAGQGIAVSDFVERFCTQVFVPFIYHVAKMNANLLPATVIKSILNDELQSSYLDLSGKIKDLRTAKMSFDVLAGARLSERKAISQSLPLLSQFLQNQFVVQGLALEGKKVNTYEVVKMIFEASGSKAVFTVIQDMTPQEKQQAQANQPAALSAAKINADKQNLMTKIQGEQTTSEQNNMAKAALQILRHNEEAGATPEALTGSPDATQGFGADL